MDKTLQLCWKSCLTDVKVFQITRFYKNCLEKLTEIRVKVQDFLIITDLFTAFSFSIPDKIHQRAWAIQDLAEAGIR